MLTKTYKAGGAVTLLALSCQLHAGGFALIEHGASGLGNSYAGASAAAKDSSTIWFNPAGMSLLEKREVAVAAHVINSNVEFTDRGTSLNYALGGAPLGDPDNPSANDASPGGSTGLPNFYYVSPVSDKFSYGLGIGVPYGSATEYDDDWVGRYSTVKSGINVIDINPSISYKVSEKVRLGAGISVQQLSAELGQAVDSGAACFAIFDPIDPAICINSALLPGNVATDGYANVTGDSTAISFNIGALFLPRPDTRIGVAYRHGTSHELDGDVEYTTNETLQGLIDQFSVPALLNGGAKADVDLPATLSFSVAHEFSEKLEILADATWTGWSSFEELRIRFDLSPNDSFQIQDWKDVWRISAGVNYQLNNKVTLRGGWAYDQEPIPNESRRSPRIPGNDRTWISAGLGYQFNTNASIDFGYAHLFLDDSAIDNLSLDGSAGAPNIRGEYSTGIDIASFQFSWTFN
ncbi:MAG: outer membrane protein transport protein [Granulosicoccus sp.]|nr:outer membrane protein transport protein [Granulosicoccus sp.]